MYFLLLKYTLYSCATKSFPPALLFRHNQLWYSCSQKQAINLKHCITSHFHLADLVLQNNYGNISSKAFMKQQAIFLCVCFFLKSDCVIQFNHFLFNLHIFKLKLVKTTVKTEQCFRKVYFFHGLVVRRQKSINKYKDLIWILESKHRSFTFWKKILPTRSFVLH